MRTVVGELLSSVLRASLRLCVIKLFSYANLGAGSADWELTFGDKMANIPVVEGLLKWRTLLVRPAANGLY